MFSPCSQGVSSSKNPNSKNMQNNNTCPSLTKDGQFTSLGPRALLAAHCSWGVLEEGQSRMGKSRKYIHRDLRLTCVCVCVLCRLHICTCVFQCVVCAIKNLTKVLIIMWGNHLCTIHFFAAVKPASQTSRCFSVNLIWESSLSTNSHGCKGMSTSNNSDKIKVTSSWQSQSMCLKVPGISSSHRSQFKLVVCLA